MTSIKARLLDPAVRPALVQDCCNLIEQTVKNTKGMSGLLVKGAYSTVKAIKSGFVEGVVDALLDEWIEKLEIFEAEHAQLENAGSLRDYLVTHKERVANALLEVTDKRAETTKHKTAAKVYHKLRPSALTHVTDVLPALADVVAKYSA